jgi:hypothetical protein
LRDVVSVQVGARARTEADDHDVNTLISSDEGLDADRAADEVLGSTVGGGLRGDVVDFHNLIPPEKG